MDKLNMMLSWITVAVIIVATAIAIASMLRFSSILIKLVILEVLTNLLMAGIALWAYINKQAVFIDICLTLALIMFLGVVAYYQFLLNRDNTHAQFDQ